METRPRNRRLRHSAVAMVAHLAGGRAERALPRPSWRIKDAVLVARGLAPQEVRTLLAGSDDSLREALARLGAP